MIFAKGLHRLINSLRHIDVSFACNNWGTSLAFKLVLGVIFVGTKRVQNVNK